MHCNVLLTICKCKCDGVLQLSCIISTLHRYQKFNELTGRQCSTLVLDNLSMTKTVWWTFFALQPFRKAQSPTCSAMIAIVFAISSLVSLSQSRPTSDPFRCLSIALNRWINGRLLGTSKVGELSMPLCLLDLSSCPAFQQVEVWTDQGSDDNSDPCNPGHGSSLSSYCLHSRQKWFDSLIIIVMYRIIIIRFWEGNYVHNLLINSWEIHHKKNTTKTIPMIRFWVCVSNLQLLSALHRP